MSFLEAVGLASVSMLSLALVVGTVAFLVDYFSFKKDTNEDSAFIHKEIRLLDGLLHELKKKVDVK